LSTPGLASLFGQTIKLPDEYNYYMAYLAKPNSLDIEPDQHPEYQTTSPPPPLSHRYPTYRCLIHIHSSTPAQSYHARLHTTKNTCRPASHARWRSQLASMYDTCLCGLWCIMVQYTTISTFPRTFHTTRHCRERRESSSLARMGRDNLLGQERCV
jgi:hypothetical protein